MKFHGGRTPHRAWALLADGVRRTLQQIDRDLPNASYGAVAVALSELERAGAVKREKIRGKYVYWREDIAPQQPEPVITQDPANIETPAESPRCFHCRARGSKRIPLQPLEGIEGEYECRNQADCERRILRDAA